MKMSQPKGLTALVAMIIIAAASLMIVSSMMFISIDTIQSIFRLTQSEETFASGDGCIEHGLSQLRANPSYAGETMTLGGISCTITVSGQTIRARANRSNSEFTEDIEATFQLTGGVRIIDYRKRSD